MTIESKLHGDVRAAIDDKVRVFRDCKVCQAHLDHVRHLCISLIRSHNKLNLQALQDVNEQVNHS